MNSKIRVACLILLCLTAMYSIAYAETVKPVVKYAKNFQLEYHDNYKILKVKQGDKWVKFVLYRDKKPDVDGIPIKIPVKRIVVMSSTHVAQLKAINATDCIVGIMWGGKYKWYFKDIAEKLKNEEIVDVGSASAPNYEKILELNPDLVIIYETPYNEGVKKKLNELNIPYIIDSEWQENDPLGRAEWVKFFAALTDKESDAEKYFDKVEKNVLEVKEIVKNLEKPKLLWCSIWQGKVYVPRGNSYVAKALECANANYVFADLNGTGSATVTFEDLLLKGKDADVMVYSSYVKSLEDLLKIDSRLSELKPVKEKRAYAITDDYWQLGLLYTDIVIKDLAAICHPEKFEGYKLRFFVHLE